MPRFYFDTCDGNRLTPDEERGDFDGIGATCAEASRTHGEKGKDPRCRSAASRLVRTAAVLGGSAALGSRASHAERICPPS